MSVRYYPAFLDIRKFPAVIIGGGIVAYRKVEMLLKFGATVTVISPEIVRELDDLADQDRISLIRKRYETGDLKGYRIAIVATNDRDVNERAYCEAESAGMLVNVVDKPDLCNFIVPSMVKRGSLLIAISTEGKSPAMAKWMRQHLEEEFGPEYGTFLEFLGDLRRTWLERIPEEAARSQAFMEIIESEAFEQLLNGREDNAFETATRILESYQREPAT